MITIEIVSYIMNGLTQDEWLIPWFAGVFCLIPIVWFVVWIVLGIWVYKDANSRGMNGALWLIVVILLGIVGLIIYLLVRAGEKGKGEEIKRICPKCGRVVKEDVKFCPYCGEELK